MKRIFLSLFFLISINTICIFSQQRDSLEELKHQIRELEKIERDDNVSFDVKQINAGFLGDRRASLRKTLETKIESAKQYLFRVGSQLSNAETQAVEQNIAAWRKELALQAEGPSGSREIVASQSLSQPALLRSETPVSTMPAYAPAAPPPPQSQNKPIQSTPLILMPPDPANAFIRQSVAVIADPDDAKKLIERAFAANVFKDQGGATIPVQPLDKDFHCVIHVLVWSKPDAADQQTVLTQNWYVFNNGKAKGLRSDRVWTQEDFVTENRIYGVKKIWLLYVHLNRSNSNGYKAYYDFQFTKKTPTNVSSLFALAQVFTTFTGAAAGAPGTPENVWGGSFVETDYVPSDATVTAKITPNPITGPFVDLDKPKKFDNEGLYWWDVSVGVPVRRIKELQFDSTNNTVTAKEVDKQNAFALINLYFPPKDLKGTNSSWIPHFVGGVAIAKQPLKKFLLGAGFGPNFTNFYVGALFTEEKKPATLAEGSAATPDQLNNDLKKHFKAKFTFGINVPVRAVLATLNKKE